MKQTKKYIIAAILFIAVMLLAVAGYNYLSGRYQTEDKDSSSTVGSSDSGNSSKEKKAKDFTVLDYDGNEVSLYDYVGKPVVVNFWATWCSPCKSELPVFNRLADEYKGEITFLMVNLTDGSRDTVKSVKEFISDKGYTFPLYFDTKNSAANAYGVYSIPMTVFIGSDGVVKGSQVGAMNESSLRRNIKKIQ